MAKTTVPLKPGYKWVALSNTTLGTLMAGIDVNIVLISLPAIFVGLKVNPLAPDETTYLLWVLMGYSVITATLLVSFGRLSDIFGRVRFYNLGFLIFTVGSLLLSLIPSTGNAGAMEVIILRLVQAIGGGFLFANSAAILTDAFPPQERGMALGLNGVAFIGGSLIGLILGGFLAAINWRLVFLVNVPIGIAGTIWAYLKLQETGVLNKTQGLDLVGNTTFGAGLTILLVALTYGIMPYGHSPMGWTNPWVQGGMVAGIILLVAFVFIEMRVKDPMFRLSLFRIRMFSAGNVSGFLQGRGPGRPDVHADHLAAGHLAAAARLQLRGHAAVGRHLHGAHDGRLLPHGSALRLAVRPFRLPGLCHRRHAAHHGRFSAAGGC